LLVLWLLSALFLATGPFLLVGGVLAAGGLMWHTYKQVGQMSGDSFQYQWHGNATHADRRLPVLVSVLASTSDSGTVPGTVAATRACFRGTGMQHMSVSD
jgi:hypothetical protein